MGAEECDDGNTVDGDGCSSTCLTESGAERCGDGVTSGDEECDDGDNNNAAYGGCTPTCTFGPFCGDGHLDSPAEACDLGPDNVTTYGPGCSPACQIPPYCGDGVVNGPQELCDLGAKNGVDGPCTRYCNVIVH